MSTSRAKMIVEVLMESELYFELTPLERLELVKHLVENSNLIDERAGGGKDALIAGRA